MANADLFLTLPAPEHNVAMRNKERREEGFVFPVFTQSLSGNAN